MLNTMTDGLFASGVPWARSAPLPPSTLFPLTNSSALASYASAISALLSPSPPAEDTFKLTVTSLPAVAEGSLNCIVPLAANAVIEPTGSRHMLIMQAIARAANTCFIFLFIFLYLPSLINYRNTASSRTVRIS